MGLNYIVKFLCQAGWWIPKIHQVVSTIRNGCFACKRLNVKHFKPPDPPALPSSRVNLSCPFGLPGVDFSGHFSVQDPFKNWQMIFLLIITCFSSLAIHLETLSSIAVDDFLLAFARFTNQFGVPDELYNDNAIIFVGGASLL